MAREKLSVSTSDFANPVLNRDRSISERGLGNSNEVLVGEVVDFNPESFAWLRMSKSGDKVNWANAICYDFKRSIQFFYDHGFIQEGLPFVFGNDPHIPYQAVISFSSCEEDENSRILSKIKYGVFYYDAEGRLQIIKDEQITHEGFQPNISCVYFRRQEDGIWSVYPVIDQHQLILDYRTDKSQPVEPTGNILSNGQEREYFEMVSSLTEDTQNMKLVQRSIIGHVQKTITVPLTIDISRWVYFLGQQGGIWTKVFSEFPSSIELLK